VCVCVYLCMYMYIYICVCVCVDIGTYMCVRACVYICLSNPWLAEARKRTEVAQTRLTNLHIDRYMDMHRARDPIYMGSGLTRRR